MENPDQRDIKPSQRFLVSFSPHQLGQSSSDLNLHDGKLCPKERVEDDSTKNRYQQFEAETKRTQTPR